MHSLILHNGRLGPVEACLSPGQFGLLSGWGVFSTLRIYSGVPFAFEWHWERMSRDARRLRVRLDFHPEEIRQQLLRLIGANQAQEAAARVYFVRNRGLWSAGTTRDTDSLMFTADIASWPASSRLAVCPQARHAASPLAGVKVLSWIGNVSTLEEAQERGFDEAVLLNERGEVAECTSANLFAVRGGTLLTPPLDSGCLPGITRRTILELAPRLGLQVREQPLSLGELRAADELFLTSTTREVKPVREVEGSAFPELGPVTARVRAAFQDYVREYVERRRNAPAGV